MYHIKDEKKPNESNLFTKQCITTALFQLMEKKGLVDITITEIINRAGVSRMGFYRNYCSKENIIETYIFDCFLETVKEIEKNRTLNFSIKSIMTTTLTHFQKHKKEIKIILDNNLDYLIYNCYMNAFFLLYDDKKMSRMREYALMSFMGELFTIEMTWLRGGMLETPEQLANIYYKILKLRSKN